MTKIAELNVEHMFTAYSNSFDYFSVQYICDYPCGQKFAASWDIRANPATPYIARGSRFSCPYCKREHSKNIGHVRKNEHIPLKVNLEVSAFNKIVTLTVDYESLAFKGNIFASEWNKGKEIFRFDIESKETVFYKHIEKARGEKEVFSFPITLQSASTLLRESVLRFFQSHSLANQEKAKDLTAILKTLRENVVSRLEKVEKISMASAYMNAKGADTGMFLLPIINLANRMIEPNGDNLTKDYRFNKPIYDVYKMPYRFQISKYWTKDIYALLDRGKDEITALIEAIGIPNKDGVRKIVIEDKQNIVDLKVAFNLCKNYDLAMRLYHQIKKREIIASKYIKYLSFISMKYSEINMVRMVENMEKYYFGDCVDLYKSLNLQNKENLKRHNTRISKVHDWMAKAHREQIKAENERIRARIAEERNRTYKKTNYVFDVPDHIVNRLTMQRNRLKFYLPKESLELLDAGESLDNCLAMYGKSMNDNKTWIVLMADDKGILVAGLQIKDNELVQAEINGNVKVKHDMVINQAVIDWAKETGITIKTKDVYQEEENTVSQRKAS